MQVAHSFLAILAGFIAVIGFTGIATALLKRFAPDLMRDHAKPDPLAMAIHVGLNLAFSLLGGYVTARFAQSKPLVHALMLAIVVLLLSAISAVQMKDRKPIYYLLILTAVPPLAVLAGGILRLHQMGLHW